MIAGGNHTIIYRWLGEPDEVAAQLLPSSVSRLRGTREPPSPKGRQGHGFAVTGGIARFSKVFMDCQNLQSLRQKSEIFASSLYTREPGCSRTSALFDRLKKDRNMR